MYKYVAGQANCSGISVGICLYIGVLCVEVESHMLPVKSLTTCNYKTDNYTLEYSGVNCVELDHI